MHTHIVLSITDTVVVPGIWCPRNNRGGKGYDPHRLTAETEALHRITTNGRKHNKEKGTDEAWPPPPAWVCGGGLLVWTRRTVASGDGPGANARAGIFNNGVGSTAATPAHFGGRRMSQLAREWGSSNHSRPKRRRPARTHSTSLVRTSICSWCSPRRPTPCV